MSATFRSLQPAIFLPQSLIDGRAKRNIQGYVAIPKSSSKTRLESNLRLFDFELTEQEMTELDALDECEFDFALTSIGTRRRTDDTADLVTDWDPTNTP